MRFVLTWGHGQPPDLDLDSTTRFFDKDGNHQCTLSLHNLKCGDYGSLDTNVSSIE